MITKIIKFVRFWKYNTLPEHLNLKSKRLVLFGADKAFKFFQDKQFRELIGCDKMEQVEQDRIFNELTVSNLIMLMFLVEQLAQETDDEEKKEFLNSLCTEIPEFYSRFLREIGIPEEFAEVWDKLVKLRYDEYDKDLHQYRAKFLSNEKTKKLAEDKMFIIFQVITLGTYDHIMRGKIKPGDPIHKNIKVYLMFVFTEYLKQLK